MEALWGPSDLPITRVPMVHSFLLPIPQPTPARLLANGISQKLVIYSPKDLIEEKLAAYLKSMLLAANSKCLKLMLTNGGCISKASISSA